MVDFAGWDMPVQYSSITEEHHAVRKAAGLFDISHMARIRFRGPDACGLLDHLLTNDVTKIDVGRIRYSLITNETGGILDDVLVYRFSNDYLLVVNASNRSKIVDWIEAHRQSFDVVVEDLTNLRCMLALQGPRSIEILNPLTAADISQLRYYSGVETQVDDQPAIVSRTGYTGEDGFEVVVASEHAAALWERIIQAGADCGLRATGLGCRDTLRLEAGMPLYGHELDENTDPFTAGLSFAVRLKAGDFIGKQACQAARQDTGRKKRIGMELDGRRVAREGADICLGDDTVGRVTSGTFSPTFEKPISMGYIAADHAEAGTRLEVDIRGKRVAATIVALPFYKRS